MFEHAVHPHLGRFVRHLRVFPDAGALPERYRRLPDGEAELLVRFGDGRTSASLVGAQTRVLDKPSPGCASTLLVRFRVAGSYPFFGSPMAQLADEVIPLELLWNAERREPLERAVESSALVDAVTSSLLGTLTGRDLYEPGTARMVRRAVEIVEAAPVLPRVTQLAAAIGSSERHLRRGFDEVVGLSPKRYLRIVRFRRALRAARSTAQPDWAAIAESAGYFDQAHMIGEFRELSGATPSALLAPDRYGAVGAPKSFRERHA